MRTPGGIIIPSYKTGYARSIGEAKYPGIRRGMIGAWIPQLGPTGWKLFDQSPYKNHGTLTNMDPATDWAVGQMGYHLDFGDTNDKLVASDAGYPTGTQPYSASIWINARVVAAVTYYGLFCYGTNTGTHVRSVYIDGGANQKQWGISQNGSGVFGSVITIDAWWHLVVTYDGTTYRLYENSRFINSGTMTTATTLGGITILGDLLEGAGTLYHFNGRIGPAYLFNRVINPNETSLLYYNPLAPVELKERVYGKAPAAATFNPAIVGATHIAGVYA